MGLAKFSVEENGKYGVYDVWGKQYLPFVLDSIGVFNKIIRYNTITKTLGIIKQKIADCIPFNINAMDIVYNIAITINGIIIVVDIHDQLPYVFLWIKNQLDEWEFELIIDVHSMETA